MHGYRNNIHDYSSITLSFLVNIGSSLRWGRTGQTDAQIGFWAATSITVDWGDGSPVTNLTGGANHNHGLGQYGFALTGLKSYAAQGSYNIRIRIGNPVNLRTLYLFQQTNVLAMPDNLDQCSQMEYLMLNGTQFQTLPNNLFNLRNLKLLTLNSTNISLLEGISRMAQLQTLNLSGSNSAALTAAVGSCRELLTITYVNTATAFPAELVNLTKCTELVINFGDITGQRSIGSQIPAVVASMSWLVRLSISRLNNFTSLAGIEKLTALNFLNYSQGSAPTSQGYKALPAGFQGLTNLKTIQAQFTFLNNQAALNQTITDYYNLTVANASMVAGGNNQWRNVSLDLRFQNVQPSGTYQAPAGYVQGSANGNPASAAEMRWVLVNQYGWTIQT